MITADDAIRLAALQQRVFRAIEDELREDGHHKSYEGAMELTLSLPNLFEQSSGPSWMLSLHCYVLSIEGRHEHWSGRSPSECIAAAESALNKLLMPYEMRRMSREMGLCCDDENEQEGGTTYADPRPASGIDAAQPARPAGA